MTITKWWNVILFFSWFALLGSMYYQLFGDPVTNLQYGKVFANNGFTPCLLCWWQRICMYPIVIIATIAYIKNDRLAAWYTAVLSAVGVCFATYHYIIQKFPVQNVFECSLANPCSATEVNYLGFVTIPFLALIAFVGIFFASLKIINSNDSKKS